MSKARLDQVRGAVVIFHRSTQDLSGGKANIWYSDKEGVSIVSVQQLTEEKPLELHANEIKYVKTKDYADKTNNQLWVLAVGVHVKKKLSAAAVEHTLMLGAEAAAAEMVQHIFQFNDQIMRDNWDHVLRTLATESAAEGATEVKVVASKFRPVASLSLQQPPAGVLVSIRIELETSEEPAILEISEADTGSDACKRITNQFIDDHHVLPTENTSLYRYIRSVVQRALMEKETAILIHEISQLKFDKLMDSPKYKDLDKTSSISVDKILTEGAADLTRIATSIPSRIGQHGSGATVVNTILKRNVEKMKLINDLAAKKYVKEQLASGPGAPKVLA